MIHTFLIKDIIVKIPKEQIEAYIAKKRNEKKERLAYIKATANKHAPFLGDLKNCVENALDEITSKSLDEYISSINEDAEPSELIDETELLKDVEILNNGLDFLNGLDFITFEEHLRPTAEQMKWGLDDGWGWKQVLKGYDVFDNSDNLDSKSGSHKKTLTISRLDIMDTFDSDLSAALQAEKDGINLIPLEAYNIDPTDNANYYRFIDTPENHQFLQEKANEYAIDNKKDFELSPVTFDFSTTIGEMGDSMVTVKDGFFTVNYPSGKSEKMEIDFNDETILNKSLEYEPNRPQNIGTGYKVFWLKDGKLYPPMVQNPNGKDTPVGEWLTAEVGKEAEPTKTGRPQVETGGEFAHANKGHVSLKPGFHISDLPEATQFNKTNPLTGKKELFPMELVWAEVEFSKDKNYQEEAYKNGINPNGNYVHALAGMNTVPQDGYYRYRTNPDPNTPEWNISGKMKVVRVLSRYEVDKILKENGKEPPLHEEDYLQKVNQKLDRLINKSATVKVNGEEHHCDGLLKGYAESIDENNKLQKKIIGLEESYKTLSNLYQSKNKKEITVEVDREEI